MTTTEISSVCLSAAIERDLFRTGLRAAVAAGMITDPKATTRPMRSPMVVSELPDRSRHYPHIVVGEASDTADRPDSRSDLWEHSHSVAIEIHTETATHLYRIRDQVRGWIMANVDALNSAGFTDPEIATSVPASWDTPSQVRQWKFIVKGTVYTTEDET